MAKKNVVFSFGRMNPPTTGHAKLIDKVRELAGKFGADTKVVLSASQDKKKNPLSGSDKVKHAKAFFPDVNIETATKEKPSFLHQLADLSKQGYKNLHVVVGSDRVKEFHDKISKYNGKPDHYSFDSISVHSAGDRDPDAKDTSGMSASKMRKLAASGDYENFRKGVPTSDENKAREMYHDVRRGMGMTEEISKYIKRPDAINFDPQKPIRDDKSEILSEGRPNPNAKGNKGLSGTKMKNSAPPDDEEKEDEGKKKKEKKKVKHYLAAKIGAGLVVGALAAHAIGSVAKTIHDHGKLQGLRLGQLASDIKKVKHYKEIRMKYQPHKWPHRQGRWVPEEFNIDKLIESHLFGTDELKRVYQSMTPGEPGYVGMNKEASTPADSREGETDPDVPAPIQAARTEEPESRTRRFGSIAGDLAIDGLETLAKREEIETGEDNSIGSGYDTKLQGAQRFSSGLGPVDSPTECTDTTKKSYFQMKGSLSRNHK